MKVIIEDEKKSAEKQDNGLVAKALKTAYGAVKNKLVSILTGNAVLSSIGTVLDILGFLNVIDRDKADAELKKLSGFMKSGVDNMDNLLGKVPLLEDIFGSEKETLKNVLKFMIFAQQVSIGAYPPEKYNIASVTAVQSTLIALVALNIATGGVLRSSRRIWKMGKSRRGKVVTKVKVTRTTTMESRVRPLLNRQQER